MPMTIEMKAEANSSFFILHSSFSKLWQTIIVTIQRLGST